MSDFLEKSLHIGQSPPVNTDLVLANWSALSSDLGKFDRISVEVNADFIKHQRWHVQWAAYHLNQKETLTLIAGAPNAKSVRSRLSYLRWWLASKAFMRAFLPWLMPKTLWQDLHQYGFRVSGKLTSQPESQPAISFVKQASIHEDIAPKDRAKEDFLKHFGNWQGNQEKPNRKKALDIQSWVNELPDGGSRSALVLSPHPDDELIGCGGTLLTLKSLGFQIHVIQMTEGATCRALQEASENRKRHARWAEAQEVSEMLGIQSEYWSTPADYGLKNTESTKARLQESLQRLKPDVVFIPFQNDFHPEHRIAWEIFHDCQVLSPIAALVLEYPVWGMLSHVDACIDISPQLPQVIEGLYVYRVAMVAEDYATRKQVMARHLSTTWQDGMGYAEVFARYPSIPV